MVFYWPHVVFRKAIAPIWALLFCACTAPALGAHYTWDSKVDSLYNQVISLQFRSLRKDIAAQDYSNLNYYLLEDYLDFLQLFVNDGEKEFELFEAHRKKRLAALSGGDSKSPWHHYVQAEMHLHHALAALKKKSFYSGFTSCRKAWKLYQANQQQFPNFKPNQKGIATLQAILGIIPQQYQWGVSMLGLEGNLKKGMETLRKLSQTPFEFKIECTLIYASLLIHLEGKHDEAWQVVKQAGYPLKGNLFTYYTAANAAIYSKHNEDALAILKNRPKGGDYVPFAFMEYLHGLALINRLDMGCRAHFNMFLAQSKTNANIKSALQKLAWSYWLEGDTAQYKAYMEQTATKGAAVLDADRQAQREAEMQVLPDVALLKARLLFDGGYFDKALVLLQDKTVAHYTTKDEQLELVYRKARLYDALGRHPEAISSYKETIKLGEEEPLYFAANAALNLGFIYEKMNDKAQARKYYNLCLTFKEHEYYQGLSQKAKAALERVK